MNFGAILMWELEKKQIMPALLDSFEFTDIQNIQTQIGLQLYGMQVISPLLLRSVDIGAKNAQKTAALFRSTPTCKF